MFLVIPLTLCHIIYASATPLVALFPDESIGTELINVEQGDGSNKTVFLEEGDIANEIDNEDDNRNATRYAVNSNWQLWSKARIPYVIDRSLLYNSNLIRKAMKHIMDKTCVEFVPRRNERDYVRIFRAPNRSCYSMIGKTGGGQSLGLGNGCLVHGVIVHELMHAIGFYHMHSRSDRDRFLSILWGNIQGNMRGEFSKNSPNRNKIMGAFDYDSIMLYGPRLFSYNGRDTMLPRQRGVKLRDIGAKFGLSKLDVFNINKLYGCSKRTTRRGKKAKMAAMEVDEV
ncbi:Zinc metalloproteinase nas-15 [Halotydeus destructor]|nr:Zinc metalloproteinase nas-15 [Halotydeus destructor]